MLNPRRFLSQQKGFSLIEVLVAILILVVGLMGLAAMQLSSLKVNQGAYYRSQASIMASDILDRMRTNREGFLAGDYNGLDTDGANPSAKSCVTQAAGCSRADIASQDFYEWTQYFNGASPLIPGAIGTVEVDASNNATVTIIWNQDEWGDDGAGTIVKSSQPQQFQVVVRI